MCMYILVVLWMAVYCDLVVFSRYDNGWRRRREGVPLGNWLWKDVVSLCNVWLLVLVCTFFRIGAFNPSVWSDEHCSSCCTLSLIRLYLDNIGSKCNRAASCLFMKELMVWETVARNYVFIFFSALEVWVFFLRSLISLRLHALTHSSISRQHREQM